MKLDDVKNVTYEDISKSDLQIRLARLSRICQNLDIPVLVMVDGFESAGKGDIIGAITEELIPKYFDVEIFHENEDYDDKFPFEKRFFDSIPAKGHFKILDRSFYYRLFDQLDWDGDLLNDKINSLEKMEKMLYDDGYIIIKFFVNISQENQKKRIEDFKKSSKKSFYLSNNDKKQNKNYEDYKKHFENVLELTDFKFSPWTLIDGNDSKEAKKAVLYQMLEAISIGIERVSVQRMDSENTERSYEGNTQIIEKLDLSKTITDEEYDERKSKLQKEVRDILFDFYERNISTVLVFEGVDAAGKDGAIERLIKKVDPRLYTVHAISAPSQEELDHHYLWRFYNKLPEDGYVGIFSRSWYGRVMVERVEGFAKTSQWDRAYDEMLEFEKQIHDHGSLVMKFFVTIDKDEQYDRFKARENNPDKMYKITDEDWRNRNKWNEYIEAMDEMLTRTDVPYAPWIIVEGNTKKYARIKVMEEFIRHAKKHLKDYDKNNKE